MGWIFATKPPLFTAQCEVEANWNWFCLSTQTHSFHTERPRALKHKSGHFYLFFLFLSWTLFSYLYPSTRLILTKNSSVALLWSYLHLVCLDVALQRTPKVLADSKYPEKPPKANPVITPKWFGHMLWGRFSNYSLCWVTAAVAHMRNTTELYIPHRAGWKRSFFLCSRLIRMF